MPKAVENSGLTEMEIGAEGGDGLGASGSGVGRKSVKGLKVRRRKTECGGRLPTGGEFETGLVWLAEGVCRAEGGKPAGLM